jgi:phage head maturation protease
MKRGDLSKMSFAFRATKQSWDDTTEPPTRTIEEVVLRDVSVVNAPAYAGTDIALRSLDAARSERRQHNFNAAAKRVAMKVSVDLRERRSASKA